MTRVTIRKIRLAAVLGAFLFLGGFTATSLVTIHHLRSDVRLVNLAGSQRMLTNRIALGVVSLQADTTGAVRAGVLNDLQAFETALEALTRGGAAPNVTGHPEPVPPPPTQTIRDRIGEVRAVWSEMRAAVQEALDRRHGTREFTGAAARVRVLAPLLVKEIGKTISAYVAEADRKIAHVRAFHLALLVAGLVLLLAAFIASDRLVVSPIARLEAAAHRIGGGDLDTPVQGTGAGELRTLAAAMDEMRGNLGRANIELNVAYDAALDGWSRALDMRDRDTEGHTQRVTEMILRLAQEAGVRDEDLVHIRRGALLHDIGKMGIADSILLKPGPLTDEEWETMRRHPVMAFELLSPIAHLRAALDIPYCHHERWDGKGYPRGIAGESIPLAARIFAVADAYDAMTTDRPYRKARGHQEALDEIARLAGTQFDPRVVELFLKISAE